MYVVCVLLIHNMFIQKPQCTYYHCSSLCSSNKIRSASKIANRTCKCANYYTILNPDAMSFSYHFIIVYVGKTCPHIIFSNFPLNKHTSNRNGCVMSIYAENCVFTCELESQHMLPSSYKVNKYNCKLFE